MIIGVPLLSFIRRVGKSATFNWSSNTEVSAPPLAVVLEQATYQPCCESVQVEENIDPVSHRAWCVQNTLIDYCGHGEPVFSLWFYTNAVVSYVCLDMEKGGRHCSNGQMLAVALRVKNPMVFQVLLFALVMSKSSSKTHAIAASVQKYFFPHLQSQRSWIKIYSPLSNLVEKGTLYKRAKALKLALFLQ